MTRSGLIAVALAWACVAAAGAQTTGSVAPFSRGVSGGPFPAGWEPLQLSGIPPTRYALVRDGEAVVVKAEADASASGLTFRLAQPSPDTRILRWRWKAERMPEGGDTTQRRTDDAVARVYVLFRRDRESMTAAQRLIEDATAAMFGQTAPHSTLLYVWDARSRSGTSFTNPYADRVRNIVVESGSARLGQWIAYERDIVADYRAAFGETPPPLAGVAIMTDADNTGSRAAAYYGDIVLEAR